MSAKKRAMRARDLAVLMSIRRGNTIRATAEAFGISPSTAWRAAARAQSAERNNNFQTSAPLKVAS